MFLTKKSAFSEIDSFARCAKILKTGKYKILSKELNFHFNRKKKEKERKVAYFQKSNNVFNLIKIHFNI